MNKILRAIIFSIAGAILLGIVILTEQVLFKVSSLYFIIYGQPAALFVGFVLGWLLGMKRYPGLIGAIIAILVGWNTILLLLMKVISSLVFHFLGLGGDGIVMPFTVITTFILAPLLAGLGYLIDLGVRKLIKTD